MKKFLFLFSFILFFSCSKEDNSTLGSSKLFLERLDGKAFVHGDGSDGYTVMEFYNRSQFLTGYNIWEEDGCRTERFTINNNVPTVVNDGPNYQYTVTYSILEENNTSLEILLTSEGECDGCTEAFTYRLVILSDGKTILETINGDTGRTFTETEKLSNYCNLL